MAIKVETMKEETKEISFPYLMKTNDNLVILFTSKWAGIVVCAAGDFEVGELFGSPAPCTDSDMWTPSPPITLSNA